MTVAAVWASLTGLEPHCSAMGTKWVEIQDMGVLHPVLRQRALCWGSPRRWGGNPCHGQVVPQLTVSYLWF